VFEWGNLWKYDLSSSVKRRLSTDSDELSKASDIVQSLSGSPTSFSATELLIVTWLDVAYPKKFSMEPVHKNIFQVIVATDGTTSAVIYSYQKIETELGKFGTVGLQKDTTNACGFTTKTETQLQSLLCRTNIRKPGCWVFPLSSNFNEPCPSNDFTESLSWCEIDNVDECGYTGEDKVCSMQHAVCTDEYGPVGIPSIQVF
jgi:hypothetical protein